ncbi:MAG: hypothetical protein HND48_22675 [Chloroflexi bacterium]|nr:hypothetical protein [Chloroflexota bacterium]
MPICVKLVAVFAAQAAAVTESGLCAGIGGVFVEDRVEQAGCLGLQQIADGASGFGERLDQVVKTEGRLHAGSLPLRVRDIGQDYNAA